MNSTDLKCDVLVIGFGNEFHGDDGIGWLAARKLADLKHPHSVRVISCHQLMPELAEQVAAARLVIFIDASLRDPPGEVTCHRVDAALTAREPFSHHLDPAGLMALARTLFGQSPRAHVFSIGGEFFGYRQGLSDPVLQSEDEVIKRVEGLIAWWQGRVADCPDAHAEVAAHA